MKKYSIAGIKKDFKLNYLLYVMLIPALVYVLIFNYYPMYGAILSFKEYSPAKGILGSKWVGLEHFRTFFSSVYFGRILFNTFRISALWILISFPAPILLALFLNEIKINWFKRVNQTVTYLPYFVAEVVIASLIISFVSERGPIGQLFEFLGGKPQSLLTTPGNFPWIYVISGVWQGIGFGSIIYIAAISGVNPELYDASMIDGAGRLGQVWHITLPGIMPTIIILLILTLGGIMNVGYTKILLLYNANIYETADVISTFTYRKGLIELNFGYSTAVGLFNSVINFIFLGGANYVSRRLSDTSLW